MSNLPGAGRADQGECVASPQVLKPYVSRRDPGRVARLFIGAALIMLAAFYGLMCAVLPMQVLFVPLVPILLLIALILWMLPDIGGVKEAWLATGLVWYVALNALWPSYVALNAPGLPWITPIRIALFATLAITVLNFSMSSEMRRSIIDGMNAMPAIRKLFWGFWAITTLSLAMSGEPLFSITKYANNQIYWTMMFALSAWLGLREGFAMRISRIMAWTIIVVALFSLAEVRIGQPVWLSHLPSFLKVDASLLAQLGTGNGRLGGLGDYRTRGTFTGALYFAEYLGLALPFVLHFAITERRFTRVALLLAGLLLVATAMVYNNARTSALALVLTPVVYFFMLAWRVRLQRPNSITATAALFAYPGMAVILGALVVFWRRLHVMIIGGGQQAASTDTRGIQWMMGLPKIATHPFGHGVGRSGNVLGYFNPGADNPTVDSYYLTLLLDYGPLGLLAFLGLFGLTIWIGFRAYNKARTPEMLLLAPMTVALFNFVVIKAVASTENNMPIMFIMMGCVVALAARQNAVSASPATMGAAENAVPFGWKPATRPA